MAEPAPQVHIVFARMAEAGKEPDVAALVQETIEIQSLSEEVEELRRYVSDLEERPTLYTST